MKQKELDINNPEEAFLFLTEAMPSVFPGITHVVYENGKKKTFLEMSDDELVDAAWHMLPIYQAAHPDAVEIIQEH